MSDLQTDIQTVSDGFGCNHTTDKQYAALENVEDAARRVANPDLAAALKPWWAYFEESGHTAEDTVLAIVFAALGITEDT